MRRKAIVLGICVIIGIGVLSSRMGHYKAGTEKDTNEDAYEYYYTNAPTEVAMETPKLNSSEPVEYIPVDTDPDSYTVLVNRTYPISKDYIPEDLVVPEIAFSFWGTYEKSYMRQKAATALEALFEGAAEEGYSLKGVSGYRSYDRQEQIYERNVSNRGEKATDKVSAKPGTSEHQTGLAIDVSCSSVGCSLTQSFGNTPEGKWLKENCHKYGFIIRYPKNKTKITGYSYEPWHIRYVGKNLAKHLYKNGLTLEEYYQLTTVGEQVASDPVEDTDTNMSDEPQMTSAPTPKPTIVPTKKPKDIRVKATRKPVKKVKTTPTPETTEVVTPKPTRKPTPSPVATSTPKPVKTPTVTKAPVVTEAPASDAPDEVVTDTEE